MTTIDARRHGVLAGTGKNMITELRAALKACAGAAAPTLALGGGLIDVWDDVGLTSFQAFLRSGTCGEPEKYWPPEFRIALDVRDVDDLTIDGEGATLMMHGFTQPFQFVDCDRLTIRNFTIDWNRPPYSVATVLSCRGVELTVRVWEEFSWEDNMSMHILGEYDPSGVCTERQYRAHASRKLSSDVVVISLDKEASVRSGQTMIIRHTTASIWSIDCLRCGGVTMENLTIHATPGVAILLRGCSDMRFDAVHVVPRPHSRRIQSSSWDAIMISGCFGSLEYTRCRFEGMGDDAISTGGTTRYRVLGKDGNRLSALFEGMDDYHNVPHALGPRVGNHLELLHLGEGIVQVLKIVSSVFDQKTGALGLVLDGPVSPRVVAGDLVVEQERLTSVRVSQCVFLPNRSRGIIVYRCRSVLVEDCLFYRTGGTAIFFFQGFGGRHVGAVRIRNNTFMDCGHGVGHMGAHGIYVEDHWFELPDDIEGGRPYVRGLTVEGNTFIGDQGPSVVLKGCIRPTVAGNRFIAAQAEPVVHSNCVGARNRRNER